MSKVQDLNDAVKKIDTDDYNKAIYALGGVPLSEIMRLKSYEPKKAIVEAQIGNAKKDVGLVSGSLDSLDKKLEEAQNFIDSAIKSLASQNGSAEILNIAKKNLKTSKTKIEDVRSNVKAFRAKLSELGTTIK